MYVVDAPGASAASWSRANVQGVRERLCTAPSSRYVLTLICTDHMSYGVKSVNILQLRQSLGKVVSLLEKSGEPVLVERRHQPVAVLISLQDFRERFVEKAAAQERDRVLEEIDALATSSADPTPAVEILRKLRDR